MASTESLYPQGMVTGKRTLLLVYVHGFMGDETSFQSFPAHVHAASTELLKATHVVHTKIYPQYRARRSIAFARDAFSTWLRPHESPSTDVILLGHSMGGILNAEVCLKPLDEIYSQGALQHRILGSINLDVPFLGIHPGVVSAGLSSLFRKDEAALDTQSPEAKHDEGLLMTTLNINNANGGLSNTDHTTSGLSSGGSPLNTPIGDPNYNPRFDNDVILPNRTRLDSAFHFLNKHANDLTQAARSYITSHVEFASTMADYKSLSNRYDRFRALEDQDDTRSPSRRVRFVNFYTVSTGRPKRPRKEPTNLETETKLEKTPSEGEKDASAPTEVEIDEREPEADLLSPLSTLDPHPIESDDHVDELSNLPPIPAKPSEPSPFDPSLYPEKDVRKIAEKEHSRQVKTYSLACKHRDKAIKERRKLLEKREKAARREEEKTARKIKEAEALPKPEAPKTPSDSARPVEEQPQLRLNKKFCRTPPKGLDGQRDPTWVKVAMEGVDEVGAHCGIFFSDKPHYAQLITDVVAVMESWIERTEALHDPKSSSPPAYSP